MSEKFNELIELIISEENDQAKELFHEIIVDKSRSIYESLIDEDEVVDEDEEVDESDEDLEESDFDEELGGDAAERRRRRNGYGYGHGTRNGRHGNGHGT